MKILLCCVLAFIAIAQAAISPEQHPRFSGYIYQNQGSQQQATIKPQQVREKISDMLEALTSYLTFTNNQSHIDVTLALSMINDIVKIHSDRILNSVGTHPVAPITEKINNYIPRDIELSNTVSNILGNFLDKDEKQ